MTMLPSAPRTTPMLPAPAPHPSRRRPTGPLAGDRGIAAIWLAIGIGLFMSFAAMAVDIGNWYLVRTEVQTATDAAALAGSALLPADGKAAREEAVRVAVQHGFRSDQVELEVIDGSIISVTIRAEIDNYFLPAIGFDNTQVIAATALAEYEGNVAMGSPEAQIGNDPESGGAQPDFSIGVEGPGYTKVNGDRFQPNDCGNSSVSYCDTSVASTAIQNLEFDENGYFFAVDVEVIHGQDFVFEVFDPAYVNADNGSANTCNYTPSSTVSNNLEDLTDDGADYVGYDGGIVPEGWYNDTEVPEVSSVEASVRYQSGRTIWCLGDGNGGSNPVDTAIIIREPDDTPWNPLDNPAVTQIGCQPTSFEGYDVDRDSDTDSKPSIAQLIDPTNTTWRSQGEWKVENETPYPDWTLAETYRRWVEVCRIPSGFLERGKYLIQVSSTHSTVNPLAYDATKDESGLNAMSLRAGYDDGTGTPNNYGGAVKVYAEGHLPIFANSDAANPEFHLARVVGVSRDRTLTVEIFDIGDAGSLSMQVLPPADSNMGTFSGCAFDLDGYGSPGGATASTCSVTTNSNFNGRVLLIQVPIPESYTCDETSGTGCWVKLRMNGSDIHDFTTWSAYISGDPVRLIE